MSEESYRTAEEFREERERLNDIILENADINMKRFFNLDTKVYEDGALPAKTKEMLGLTASTVLKCDDCIQYHLIRCKEEGVSDEELTEALSVALLVGGSITIPHLRKAFNLWDEMNKEDG